MMDRSAESIDEELTAYLDRELSAADAADLEKRLVDDEQLRKRLASLRKSFDLLDELPDTPHNQKFTQSTIEMVVADLKQSSAVPFSLPTPAPKREWFHWPRILIVSLIALFVGCAMGLSIALLQMRSELGRIELIANAGGLQDVTELSVIRSLTNENDLIEYLSTHYADRMIPDIPESIWSRRSWVQSLNARQLSKLDTARENLQKLPSDERTRLEAIQQQIEMQSDHVLLNKTVRLVGQVMDSLPNTKRQDLESLTSDQRIRFLREQLCTRAALLYAYEPSGSDAAAIEDWSKRHFIPSLITLIPAARRESDIQGQLAVLYSRYPVLEGYRLDNQDELIIALADTLSPFGRKLIEGIDRSDQLYILTNWLLQGGMESNQLLVNAMEGMRRDLREEIELMDPAQAKRMLQDRRRRPGSRNR